MRPSFTLSRPLVAYQLLLQPLASDHLAAESAPCLSRPHIQTKWTRSPPPPLHFHSHHAKNSTALRGLEGKNQRVFQHKELSVMSLGANIKEEAKT